MAKNLILWLIIAAVLVTVMNNFSSPSEPQTLNYSDFLEQVKEGRVERVTVDGFVIIGKRSDGDTFKTIRPAIQDNGLIGDLLDNNVLIEGKQPEQQSIWTQLLVASFPILVIIAVFMFFMRQMQGGAGGKGGPMSFGKSKARLLSEDQVKTTFADVAGCDEAKEEVHELVEFLRDPGKFQRLGGRIPRGVLMVGPPGTGKTLLAKAIAGEAKVPFFTISGSDFVEMFVGVGASRVRDMFEQAKKHAPCIIFIDEIDAVGRHRGAGLGGGHDEREQTLNQLLTEMDGFDSSVGLIILAATNRPEILDQALLRAGRFDRQVLVDRPDKKGRLDILKVHVKKVTLAQDIDLEQVAALTTGFSGADLANLVNEAALNATRRKAQAVELQDFTAAIERIVAGLERKNRVLNPKERETVAYHEMGHALVALALPGTDPVHKISIVPRGIGALGYTLQRPTEDRFLMTRADLEHKIAVLLGGRAAEKLVFGELSTGASDDLARATDIARDMITRFGMDEGLGYVAFEAQRPRFLDAPELVQGGCRVAESTQTRIDQAIRDIVMGVFDRAYRILEINREVLERCARELLARETLDEYSIRQLTQGLQLESPCHSSPTAGAMTSSVSQGPTS
ncbi:MAG TPA: cell division protein FtsH [Pseudomonas sp.]|nr:cell division protein FtsH [Pseudomonas sp.]